MTFFDNPSAHIGNLVQLKTQLYWLTEWRWDRVQERICMLLNVGEHDDDGELGGIEGGADALDGLEKDYYLHLLIDGRPNWVRLNRKSFEVIE